MFESLTQRLSLHLENRKTQGNLRKLRLPTATVDFYSNDYLGLAQNIELQQQIQLEYDKLPNKMNGATGSRLLSGNSDFVMKLEEELATLFGGEAALLFNSGYAANTALLATVPQRGDTIIADALIHASLHEGCRLSYANSWTFRHNDLEDLEKKLKLAKGEKFVVVESVYSMDGDNGVLPEIAMLCEAYDANLIIDEAHTTGIYGQNGNGLCNELGLQAKTFARVYTFGKAMGCHGACVVGSTTLIDYLVNFAKAFIYTTAQPLHNLLTIAESFKYIAQNPQYQQELAEKIVAYQAIAQTFLSKTPHTLLLNQSPIQIIQIEGNEECKKVANRLIDNDLEVRAILSPTVPVGAERLRICLHNYNTAEQIETLLRVALVG
jgi:8-amino-7-oxononanoate synthase